MYHTQNSEQVKFLNVFGHEHLTLALREIFYT